ncbi:hypothetical protein SCE1572_14645 [Sorangium cellulosum So0157-2]|uniref:Uncharacterized protein n=1 Tax=Sorangium cellulosum So0157-2 TaxID=1254432 RepID=S4XUS2_SORCE|nr:hypothetical protein SCE1572_14645 [Sorangium cellulosum So0157-2]
MVSRGALRPRAARSLASAETRRSAVANSSVPRS